MNPDLTFSRSFGSKGSGNGQFKSPYDIAIDSEGLVYVTDYGNNRIQKFSPEGSLWVSLVIKDSALDSLISRMV